MKQFIIVFALLTLASFAGAQENFLNTPANYAGGTEPEIINEAAELNNKGVEKALKQRDYNAASELFRQAVKSDARCLQCHYNLGISLFYCDQQNEAITVFTNLISLKSDYAHAYAGLGEVYNKKGLFKESAAAYRRAGELDASDPILLGNLGNALYQIKEYEEALKHFNRALEINPASAGNYSNRGVTLMTLGRTKEAIRDLRKAVALDPAIAEPQNNLGVALSALGRKKEAHQFFVEALRLRPDWSHALYNLTLNYLELGRRDEASSRLSALKKIDPTLAKNAEKVFYARFVVDASMR